MTHSQKDDLILAVTIIAGLIIIVSLRIYFSAEPEPIESTRPVVMHCTVISNIEGVITLNDDCKITVIGEVRK